MENNHLSEGKNQPQNSEEAPTPKRRRPRIQKPNESNSTGSRVPDRPVNQTKPPRTDMDPV
ncbi:MAG: hypothetical protein LH606_10210 [Cytophagaceae bacterium]|nr:hypothetical protein [Cytophagaceae bacterium]